MSLPLVQGSGTTNNGNKTADTAVTWGAARTPGNLLVLVVGSNALVTTPTGWDLAVSKINTAAIYIFYRIADNGAQDSPTINNSWFRTLTWIEYSNNAAAPLDVVASAQSANGSSSCSSGTTGTLAQSDAVAIAAFAGLDSFSSTAIWNNSFTNGFSKIAGANSGGFGDGVSVVTAVATKDTSATTGVETTGTTNEAMSFGGHGVVAVFKAAAGDGGDQNVTLPAISSSSQIYIPGGFSRLISLPAISSTANLFTGAVGFSIQPPFISSTSQVFAPNIAKLVGLPTIASGAQLFGPSLPLTLGLPTIASGSQLFAPSLSANLLLPSIASGVQLFSPALAPNISLPSISSTAQLFNPSLPLSVALPSIASGVQLFAPTLEGAGLGIFMPFIESGALLFKPLLFGIEAQGDPGQRLLVCVDTEETWEEHFSSRGWTCIQDQIDAGYPLYGQPAKATASYEKIWDFGQIFPNVIVNLLWNQILVAGSMTTVTKLATSTDGVTYSSFETGTSTFGTNVRYVKVRFEFSGGDDKSLSYIYNVQLRLDVKFEIDSGRDEVTVAADGKLVNFNKTFSDVNSITVTPNGTTAKYGIADFSDVPNPTGFTAILFDSSGNRVTGEFFWKARGVVLTV